MTKYPLGKNNNRNYLDENELFILYSLMRRKYISSQDEVFTPKKRRIIHITEEIKKLDVFKKEIENLYNAQQSKLNSSIIALYLLGLGQELDKNNFSIQCTADYSLNEDGFLCDSSNYGLMMDYLHYIIKGKKSDSGKFNALTDKQKKSIEECVLDKNKRNGKIIFPHSESVLPIKDYRETILNKKGDKDFIVLVNKLITYETGGKWDKDDFIKFIEIFSRHNRELNLFQEDAQKRLSELIFRNANIVLEIKDTKKLEKDLSEYIDLFIDDKLNGFCRGVGLTSGFFRSSLITPYERVMFGFEKQKEILFEHINKEYKKYKRNDLEITNPFLKPEHIDDTPKTDDEVKIILSDVNEAEELFLFVHTMIALSKLKNLRIIGSSYGQTELFDPLDRGFLFKIILGDYFFKNNETKKQELSKKLGVEENSKKEAPPQLNNQDLTTVEKKKLCILEKLKEEWDLTPNTPVKTHMYLGYYYTRPAGEASLYGQKLSVWIQECNLNDRLELENILAIFQQKGMVSKFIFSEQEGNLKIQFPEEIEGRYNDYKAKILGVEKQNKVKLPRQDNLLLTKELKPQITTGDLVAYSDGTIRYNGKILDLRNQLKDLCRFFMRNPKRLLTIDDIREEIVSADKRKTTPNSTIAKYVSELHNSLKIHFKKEVIFNQKEEGWYFKTSE